MEFPFPPCEAMSSGFHGEKDIPGAVALLMVRPLVLVVRETPSLADSVQILLETVGFRVVSFATVASALDRIGDRTAEPIRAVVVAGNQPFSETLRGYPQRFPPDARSVPILVVGSRALQDAKIWPSNVKSLDLPLDAGTLVSALAVLTGIEAGASATTRS